VTAPLTESEVEGFRHCGLTVVERQRLCNEWAAQRRRIADLEAALREIAQSDMEYGRLAFQVIACQALVEHEGAK